MRVELWRGETCLADGRTGANGLLDHPGLQQRLPADNYQAVFYVAEYYRKAGVPLPAQPFLNVVRYDFGVAQPEQHYHLPFKCTPWGYSCFRGGA